jgi:hypothetical protein
MSLIKKLLPQKGNPVKKMGSKHTEKDILACQLLTKLLDEHAFIPYTDSALSFSGIHTILNDCIIHQRKLIVEFGSGISTIVLAKLIQRLNLTDTRFISFDHDAGWVNICKGYIAGSGSQTQIIHAPLTMDGTVEWYDKNIINDCLNAISQKPDCIIVDGPPAWQKGKRKSRMPALDCMQPRLAGSYSIFLDDVSRKGEQEIKQAWDNQLQFSSVVYQDLIAVWLHNSPYNVLF